MKLKHHTQRHTTRNCPYCYHRLLRHISGQRTYWFCRNCWQEMYLLEENPFRRGLKSTS